MESGARVGDTFLKRGGRNGVWEEGAGKVLTGRVRVELDNW